MKDGQTIQSMEDSFDILKYEYPFLMEIIQNLHAIDRVDAREWDNSFEKNYRKCLSISRTLKEYNLL